MKLFSRNRYYARIRAAFTGPAYSRRTYAPKVLNRANFYHAFPSLPRPYTARLDVTPADWLTF